MKFSSRADFSCFWIVTNIKSKEHLNYLKLEQRHHCVIIA